MNEEEIEELLDRIQHSATHGELRQWSWTYDVLAVVAEAKKARAEVAWLKVQERTQTVAAGEGQVEVALTKPVDGTWWVTVTNDQSELAVVTIQSDTMSPKVLERLAESVAKGVAGHYE